MEEKIVSLKHARLRKQSEDITKREKQDRDLFLFIEEILDWWEDNRCLLDEIPEFIRIAKEIDDLGITNYLEEQLEACELITQDWTLI